jgi:hypothetical protein
LDLSDFLGTALLYFNVSACAHRQVKGAGRGCDIEGNVMFSGQDTEAVGPDLICSIAIGGDAIRAGDNGLDQALFHDPSGHVVADESAGNSRLLEFPGRETSPLQ